MTPLERAVRALSVANTDFSSVFSHADLTKVAVDALLDRNEIAQVLYEAGAQYNGLEVVETPETGKQIPPWNVGSEFAVGHLYALADAVIAHLLGGAK